MAMSAILDAARKNRLRYGEKPSRSSGLRSIWPSDEPIDMEERRHGYFPRVFVWRGQRYDVYAVERCWTISRRNLGGKVERYCFRVRAQPRASRAGERSTFEIYQDVQHNTWHMQRQLA